MKPRVIQIDGDVAYVPLTKGYTALIDAADVPLIEGWNWCVASRANDKYAVRCDWNGGKQKLIRMHRVIMGSPKNFDIDHKSGDGLDNRRCNLRLATPSQNGRNTRLSKKNTSGVKGVTWFAQTNRWAAQIFHAGKRFHLGYFSCVEDAAKARKAAEAIFHGEFARLS